MKQLLQQLLAIENFDVFLVLGILIFFGSIESFAGYLRHSKRKKGDWLQEVLSFFLLSTAIKPTIVASVFILGNTIYPEGASLLSQQSFITVFFGYILVDDLLQYWYHRSAHEYPFLWKLHRSHHQAEEMGYFVAYRNARITGTCFLTMFGANVALEWEVNVYIANRYLGTMLIFFYRLIGGFIIISLFVTVIDESYEASQVEVE
ncbi:MAG: sterol desaturase family protein, partial [Flavobacteriaceae bacterium]